MQKTLIYTLISILLLISLSACQNKSNAAKQKPLIVTTIHPYELIVRELVDTLFIVQTLLPPNASMYSWSPGPQDMLKLEKADLIVSNGLGLENNLEKALTQAGTKHVIASSFVDKKKLIYNSDEEPGTANPHVWASPELLIEIIIGLSNELGKRYPMSKAVFEGNARMMIMELNQVDSKIMMEKNSYPKAATMTLNNSFPYFLKYFKIDSVNATLSNPETDLNPKQSEDLTLQVKSKNIKAVLSNEQINPTLVQAFARKLKLKIVTCNYVGIATDENTIADYLWLNWIALKAGL